MTRSQPSWTDTDEHDLGVVLVELFGYLGDLLSYYQDQIAAENHLRTRRRVAVALGVAAFVLWRCRKERVR